MKSHTLSRRGFFHATGAAAAAALATGVPWTRAAFAHGGRDGDRLLPRNRLGIQLFTIRDKVSTLGFEAVFRELSRMGYAEVEFAGYNQGSGLPPITVQEIRRLLDRFGLRGVGSHVGLTQFRDNLTRVLDDAEVLGLRYIGTANAPDALFPPAERGTPEAYSRAAEFFNTFGEAARDRGMKFYQHNHAGEFAIVNGTRLWDVTIAETDPDLVFFEFDIFWAYVGQFLHGGFDPIAYVKAQPDRFPLYHVKDGVRSSSPNGYSFVDVGDGVHDFRRFFETVGVRGHHYIVERDDAPTNPAGSFSTAERSLAYLRSLRPCQSRRDDHDRDRDWDDRDECCAR
jgi:sugar phosphate isomerase/epimerase